MKTLFRQYTFIITLFTILLSSCEISDESILEPSANPSNSTIELFSYGTDVVYLKQGSTNITPQFSQDIKGTFSASPRSLLALNPQTGEIDLAKSETGITYTIDFIAEDGTETSQELLVSGIDYRQTLLEKDSEGLLIPVYNDNPSLAMPKGSFRASSELLAINPETGVIDVRQSVQNGALGKKDRAIFTIKYQLQDESSSITNSIKVEIYHYSSKALIPQALLEKINANQGAYREGGDGNDDDDEPYKRPPPVIIIG